MNEELHKLARRLGEQGAEPQPLFPTEAGPQVVGLFEGYGGLTRAVLAALGGTLAAYSEIEPAACRLLKHHHPDVPNLGDVTKVDWASIRTSAEEQFVLTGGFPCQDLSLAGAGAGLRPGTRSGLWTHMAYGISVLRPQLVVIENVRGLLSADAACDLEPCPWCLGDNEGRPLRALGAVLGDLAELGYDASWIGLRAADVGAPHGRFRIFITAWPAAGDATLRGRDGRPATGGRDLADVPAGGPGLAASNPSSEQGSCSDREREPAGGPAAGRLSTPTDATRVGRREGRTEPARIVGGPDVALGGSSSPADSVGPVRGGSAWGGRSGSANHDRVAADSGGSGRRTGLGIHGAGGSAALGDDPSAAPDAGGDGLEGRQERDLRAQAGQSAPLGGDAAGRVLEWGDYTAAVHRWELILGRTAPAPTQTGKRGGQQLSSRFVEWLMGLPEGHVTGVPGLSRNEQLKLLGNGVVPAQAEAAIRYLLSSAAAGQVAA